MVFPSMSNLSKLLPNSLRPKITSGRESEQHVLSLLQSSHAINVLLQALAYILKLGLDSNVLVVTRFAAAASASGAAVFAAELLLRHPSPHLCFDAFLFNTAIRGLASSKRAENKILAADIFALMLRSRVRPNRYTFPFLIKVLGGLPNSLPTTVAAHAYAVRLGFGEDPYVLHTLIRAYAGAGTSGLAIAHKVFDKINTRQSSPVPWSALISGYVRSGRPADALELFRKMSQTCIARPDEAAVVAVLSACADIGAPDLTRWVCSYIDKEELPKSLTLCNAMIGAYAKCGDVDGAVEVFYLMVERDVVSWTSLIGALAAQGQGHKAIVAFKAMRCAGVQPDEVTFIGVLSACSHAGLVDEGRRYFDSMWIEFGIRPKIEHYGCMVDMFSRAGLVDQAVDFFCSIPMKPNAIIWRTLINACRVHGRPELAERITNSLLREDPSHGSNYVMLSNVYALTQQWEKKSDIWKAMGTRGLMKEPGCSSLDVEGEIHEFIVGDDSHPQPKEIYNIENINDPGES